MKHFGRQKKAPAPRPAAGAKTGIGVLLALVSGVAGAGSERSVRMEVTSTSFHSGYQQQKAPDGWQYLRVEYLFTNLRELRPLETDIASFSVLVEDGGYVYRPLETPGPGEPARTRRIYAREPAAGALVFLVPREHGGLDLVHFAETEDIRIELTPGKLRSGSPEPIAVSGGEGPVSISVYAMESMANNAGLVLDVGLQLNSNDRHSSLWIDLTHGFELHDGSALVRRADPEAPGVRRPFGLVAVRSGLITRGQAAFPGAVRAPGQTLVLPLTGGDIRVELPATP